MWIKLTLVLCALFTAILGESCDLEFDPRMDTEPLMCQSVPNPVCRSVIHNMTSLPNLFNHLDRIEAEQFLLNVGTPLFMTDCSPYLTQFLCSATYPICYPGSYRPIQPCRELCIAVRESCIPMLQERGLQWPQELDCNLYSTYAESLCVWTGNPCKQESTDGSTINTHGSNCTARLVTLPNTTSGAFGGVDHCTEPCGGVYFDPNEQKLLSIWIISLSVITLVVSIVIFLTYILSFRQIPKVEAPIYYIAICYGIVSIIKIISVAIGEDSLFCDAQFQNNLNESALLTDATNHPLCLIVFCVVYYSTLCTWSWWAVCALQWCVTCIKSRNINNKWSVCFHIVAWCIPLVITLTALSLGHVNGDPFTRTCWIEKGHELAFLVAPLLAALLLCSVVLVLCFAQVVKIQKKQKLSDHSDPDVNSYTLIRVGVYCTLYLVPMGLLLCAYFYEYWYRPAWEEYYLQCANSTTGSCRDTNTPVFAVFMVKIATTLSMGILSLFWVVGQRMMLAWKKACCFCCWSPVNQNENVYNLSNGKFISGFQIHHLEDYPTSNTTSSASSV